MTDLLIFLGFQTTGWGIFWICTAWTFFAVTVIWLVGLFQGNHSMMDGYYGFGYAIPVWIAYLLVRPASQVAGLVLLMASLHGCRLGIYLSRRWWGYRNTSGGDQRYLGFTKKLSPGYWWKSFFVVMEPQAIVISVIGLPAVWAMIAVTPASESAHSLGWLRAVGLLCFGVGYYFETVADGQLQAFKADPHNKGRYLRTGVWTHTRHPNYFGNTVVWWGIYFTAVSGNPDIWWVIVGPVFNTIMLTGILGRAFQDKYMGSRPEYQKVMAETSGFLPFPKSRPR
jgi:steroid 5-alpha reductase family enzyme